MYRYRIGIDNGTTGRITVLNDRGEIVDYFAKPLREHRLHTKDYAVRMRIDLQRYKDRLRSYADGRVVFERPFAGTRIKAVVSGETCLEAEMIALEELGIPYGFCASTDWQPRYLAKGKIEDTKALSLTKGRERWPATLFDGDADSAFIALLLHELGHEEIDSWRKPKKKPKKKKQKNEHTTGKGKNPKDGVRSKRPAVSRRRAEG